MKPENQNKMSRRHFIKQTTGAAAAMGVLSSNLLCSKAPAPKAGIPVGLQLYSVRTECEKDLAATIAAVAEMGYQGVEFAGYYDHTAEQVLKMLEDNGIKCCGAHTALDLMLGDNLAKTIEFNKVIGNKYLIVPWLNEDMRNSQEAWLKTAALFNELNEKVKAQGMKLGYHNHGFEFQEIDGQIPWDIFFINVSEDIIMQVDLGNAMSGGGDPIAALKKFPGRATTIHLKEFSATNPKAIIGEGDVPWAEVFAICESTGGTEWYIIEEEKDVYPPLECVDLCLQNLKKLRA